MKRTFLAIAYILPVIATTSITATETNNISTSFQGFSGLINTPTAALFNQGQFHFQYSNQTETQNAYHDGDNLHFGLGLWQHLEISGRLADHHSGITDLSANIKVKMPFIPPDWFSLAAGVQDLGGAASHFNAKYLVASKDIIDDINLSIGISQGDSSTGRLNGVFGGISWQAADWAKLSLEHDAADTNLGLHLSTPQYWFNNEMQLAANILAYSSSEQLRDKFYYGVEIKVPLQSPTRSNSPHKTSDSSRYYYQAPSIIDSSGMLSRITNKLTTEGFEAIRVGKTANNTAYIELENHIYNRNQLDGLGVALAIISSNLNNKYQAFKLVLKEREVPILVVSGTVADYRAFLNNERSLNLAISTDTYNAQNGAQLLAQNNRNSHSHWLKPRLTLWPSVASAVGTEFGMFDASVALISHLELPLWPGGALSALHLTQLAETEDFKDGRYFGDWKQKNGLQEYSLHQTFALPYNIKNMTFAGRYRDSYNFLANEIHWQNNDGAHRVNILTANYNNQIIAKQQPYQGCNILFAACWPPQESPTRKVMIGMYRYYSSAFETAAELRVGQYWQQDKGIIVRLERMFGDVNINMSYKNTKLDNQVSNQFVGLGFSMPLTPRKDHSNKYIQVRGIPKWNYTVNTLVGKSHNRLTPGTGDSARLFYNLDNFYYNLDRLGQAYIYDNSYRLKQAAALTL